MKKFFEKYKADIIVISVLSCLLILPLMAFNDDALAQLAAGTNVRTNMVGNMRMTIADIDLQDVADFYSSGMSYVFWAGIANRGAVSTNDIQIILNSNNGTVDSSSGDIWIDYEGSSQATGSVLMFGR